MHKIFLTLVFTLILSYSANAVIFNEIMYDPPGADDDEWIEIFNDANETINMSGWKLLEANTNHNIVSVTNNTLLSPGEYAMIVNDPSIFLSNHSNFSKIVFDSTFSLSNAGETLVLKNRAGSIADNITYNSLTGGSGNGMSIGLYERKWNETIATPGEENRMPEICDWSVSINSSLIYDEDFSFSIYVSRVRGGAANVTISRRIENITGVIVKSYDDLVSNVVNHKTISYTPNLAPGTYLIITNISPSCNDSVSENNFAEKLIAIKGNAQAQVPSQNTTQSTTHTNESSIKIENIYDLGKDSRALFGQSIRVRLNVYKGNTRKETVTMWLEKGSKKASKVFSISVPEKYTSQEFTLPLQIVPNCKNALENGTYHLIAEGIDADEDTEDVDIYGNDKDACIEIKANTTKTAASSSKTIAKTQAKASEDDSAVTSETRVQTSSSRINYSRNYAVSAVMFESTQKKAEKLMPYLLASTASAGLLFMIFLKFP